MGELKVKKIVIHHSATPGGDVIFIRHEHQVVRGWRGPGYHKIIPNGRTFGSWPAGEDGEIQKGRPLDDDSIFEANEVGAHALGFNRETVGICLIGNFMSMQPTQAQIRSLIEVCCDLCEQFDLEPNAIVGHCDVNNTDCPGKYLYSLLPLVRESGKIYLRFRKARQS